MSDTHARLAVRWGDEEIELERHYPIQKDLREDAIALAAMCVPDYMQKFRPPKDLEPQPWMLMILRAIGELRNDGRRDRAFEDDAMQQIIRNLGILGLGQLFGADMTGLV